VRDSPPQWHRPESQRCHQSIDQDRTLLSTAQQRSVASLTKGPIVQIGKLNGVMMRTTPTGSFRILGLNGAHVILQFVGPDELVHDPIFLYAKLISFSIPEMSNLYYMFHARLAFCTSTALGHRQDTYMSASSFGRPMSLANASCQSSMLSLMA
jgi:hypothetical protein